MQLAEGETSPATLQADVMRVIHNGDSTDAAGLKAAYGVTADEFHDATQRAVWHYTDDADASAAYPSLSAAEAGLLANLLGDTSWAGNQQIALKTPPAGSTLNLFTPNAGNSDAPLQNLLSVNFVDEETGTKPVTPSTPASPSATPLGHAERDAIRHPVGHPEHHAQHPGRDPLGDPDPGRHAHRAAEPGHHRQ